MGVMTTPDFWSGQDRMLTVEDMDKPELIVFELIVFELRAGAYEQAAHVTGAEEYHAEIPFPVTITPAQLVSLPR